jgi:hypothetical protein
MLIDRRDFVEIEFLEERVDLNEERVDELDIRESISTFY